MLGVWWNIEYFMAGLVYRWPPACSLSLSLIFSTSFLFSHSLLPSLCLHLVLLLHFSLIISSLLRPFLLLLLLSRPVSASLSLTFTLPLLTHCSFHSECVHMPLCQLTGSAKTSATRQLNMNYVHWICRCDTNFVSTFQDLLHISEYCSPSWVSFIENSFLQVHRHLQSPFCCSCIHVLKKRVNLFGLIVRLASSEWGDTVPLACWA